MATVFGTLAGVVGSVARADGDGGAVRLCRTGEVAVSSAHARFQEAVIRGNCYSANTAATGVAPGTAIGTTGAFTLHNLIGSGKRLVILRASMGYISGTLGAGTVHYLGNNSAAAVPTGTAITPVNLATFEAAGSAARAFTTSTITAPALLGNFCSMGASLASTAIAPWQVVDEVDGLYSINPGCSLTLHATAAGGSSPVVVFGMQWEEVTA